MIPDLTTGEPETAPVPIAAPEPRAELGPTGLAFATPHGPLVAFCGLAGGAGTSTLAFLMSRRAAAESTAPLLLCELDGAAGGLAVLAGTSSPRSLADTASRAPDDRQVAGLPFATLEDGLRLLASPPRVARPVPGEDLQRTLTAARRAHGLTIIDCGTLQTLGARAVLGVASHIVWTVPEGPWAADRVRATLLDSGLAHVPGDVPELLAVVATRPAPARRGRRALRDAAAARCRRLVFVAYEQALAAGRLDDPRGRVAAALTAIGTFLDSPSSTPTTEAP